MHYVECMSTTDITITTGPDYVTRAFRHGELVGTTDSYGPEGRLANSERYVAFIVYGEGDDRYAEELDIDVKRSVGTRNLVTQIAEAQATAGYEPGWSEIVVDGPKIGLYF